MAASISPAAFQDAATEREQIRRRLYALLGDDGIVMLPTSPGPAPLRRADDAALDDFRTAALELLCPAGLAGLPQISIPAGVVDGGPVGLSLVGPPGSDGLLLAMAVSLETAATPATS
jgi:amidase